VKRVPVFLLNVQSKVGNILTKTEELCMNLNISESDYYRSRQGSHPVSVFPSGLDRTPSHHDSSVITFNPVRLHVTVLSTRVENFKLNNTKCGVHHSIVEPNISDQGSKTVRTVPTDEIGLSVQDWETNVELEVILTYPFDIKDTIEHRKQYTGTQNLMFLFGLKETRDNFQKLILTQTLSLTYSIQ
jgi:hypothetical protein